MIKPEDTDELHFTRSKNQNQIKIKLKYTPTSRAKTIHSQTKAHRNLESLGEELFGRAAHACANVLGDGPCARECWISGTDERVGCALEVALCKSEGYEYKCQC